MGITGAAIFLGCGLVGLGALGYFGSRRRGPAAVRGFLILYAFAWPFLAVGLCVGEYPKAHWLYFVEIGIVALSYGVRALDFRRRRAKALAVRGQNRLEV
jgi:hypothetical protein